MRTYNNATEEKIMTLNEDGELLCPKCSGNYLHQRGVGVYFRDKEDSEFGINVNVTKEVTHTTRYLTGNPSPRRDGFIATFMCEFCQSYVKLCFAQHKGHTQVSWEE
jgi:hypothetical protein